MNISVFNGAQSEDYNVIRSFIYYKPSVISNLVLGQTQVILDLGASLKMKSVKTERESSSFSYNSRVLLPFFFSLHFY